MYNIYKKTLHNCLPSCKNIDKILDKDMKKLSTMCTSINNVYAVSKVKTELLLCQII